MRRNLAEHLGNLVLAGEAENIVEMADGVLGIAARVRSPENRDRAAIAVDPADRVSGEGGEGEAAEEQEVGVGRERGQILIAGVAEVADVVAELLAPRRHCLRHDRGEARAHPALERIARRAPLGQVDHGDAQKPAPPSVPENLEQSPGRGKPHRPAIVIHRIRVIHRRDSKDSAWRDSEE